MNRFFSKLDLRDIKIDPQGSRFPPEEDETVEETPLAAQAEEPAPVVEQEDEIRQPYTPAWAAAPAPVVEPTNGYHVSEMAFEESVTISVTESVTESVDEFVAEPVAVEPDERVASPNGDVLKVSARSRPSAVAGAIAGVVRENGRAEVQAIGAGATNQAVKAVAIARDYLRETGIEAVCLPAFIDVTIDNEERTAILLVVEPR